MVMTRDEEIAALEAKWEARKGRPGFKANADAIRQRIARLKGGPDAETPDQPPVPEASEPPEVLDLGTFN
jgi:hypothetical protein